MYFLYSCTNFAPAFLCKKKHLYGKSKGNFKELLSIITTIVQTLFVESNKIVVSVLLQPTH